MRDLADNLESIFEHRIQFRELEKGKWFPVIEIAILRPRLNLIVSLLFDTGAEHTTLHPRFEKWFTNFREVEVFGLGTEKDESGKPKGQPGKSTKAQVRCLVRSWTVI